MTRTDDLRCDAIRVNGARPGAFGLDDTIRTAQDAGTIDIVAAADAGAVAAQMAVQLDAWVTSYGEPFSRAHVPLCCLFATFATPWLPLAACAVVSKTALWALAIDARADDLHASGDHAFATALEACRAVVRGDRDESAPVLALALAEIDDAVRADGHEELTSWWIEATDGQLDGTAFERRVSQELADGGSPPSIDEYLRQACMSIAFSMVAVASWSGMPRSEQRCLQELRGPLADASLVVRLANDLRGHERERVEGVVDAITLGWSAEQVSDELVERLGRCRGALEPLILRGCASAVALERQMLWGLRSYQRFDAGHMDGDPGLP